MSTESIFTDVTIKSETDAERLADAIEESELLVNTCKQMSDLNVVYSDGKAENCEVGKE